VLAIGSSFALSRIPVAATNAQGYTQLWMSSSGTSSAPAVRVGIQSSEQRVTTYRLIVRGNGGEPLFVKPQITLAPGATTTITAPVRGLKRGRTLVTAELSNSDLTNVYRRVTAPVVASR
jgi:hypothetical protein